MQKELFLTESMIVGTATSSFCSFPRCPTRLQPSEQCRLNPVLNLKASALPSISREDRRVWDLLCLLAVLLLLLFCFKYYFWCKKTPKTDGLNLNLGRCECFNLCKELVPYEDAWNWQKRIVRQKKELIQRKEDCPDTLIVLQHQPVYTMGTASSLEFLNFDIKDAPFQVYRTERGGEVTYHGPGQLVMYPIINLRNHKMDLHWYLRTLEEVIIRVLSSTFSIKASRVKGLTGVWVGNQKLAAIGIKVSQWIAYHGLALNVTTDLSPFDLIIPCGIRNRKVGSIKGLLRVQLSNDCENANKSHNDDVQLMELADQSLIKEFSEIFQLTILPKNM